MNKYQEALNRLAHSQMVDDDPFDSGVYSIEDLRSDVEVIQELVDKSKLISTVENIQKWFVDKDLEDADPKLQLEKLQEENQELIEAFKNDDFENIKEEIADMIIVLIGMTLQLDLIFSEILEAGYDKIKNRKGKTINGTFVQEAKLKR